ncbi:MAG: S8 family serine peptidase, partial [Rhizobiales bacterium]|nr:S8 family serine peptidase [Hyphomicrobiales bacterium]
LLNPPVPVGSDPGGVAIAHIDTGVNYLLPHVSSRLARDNSGTILGWDMFDDDDRPFDGDPGASLLMPRRHGTSVATIILAEAPDARLVPYRHPGRDFGAFRDLIEDIAEGPARIIAMPLGGYHEVDWRAFAGALAAHPELLVVVSAGNDGRDIDAEPVFPASFDIENLLVVTSVDDFGMLPIDSNWGLVSVDIAVPAEQIATMDHRGASVRASGASYAVPRIAALAARFAAANPTWSTSDIKSAIIALARPLPRQSTDKIRFGWLPNPALVGPNPPLR